MLCLHCLFPSFLFIGLLFESGVQLHNAVNARIQRALDTQHPSSLNCSPVSQNGGAPDKPLVCVRVRAAQGELATGNGQEYSKQVNSHCLSISPWTRDFGLTDF